MFMLFFLIINTFILPILKLFFRVYFLILLNLLILDINNKTHKLFQLQFTMIQLYGVILHLASFL